MPKKPMFYIIFLIVSITMMIGSSFVESTYISGLLLATGAGMLGGCLAKLYFINFEKKNPEVIKENEIEFKDERNVLILQRAKAKSADITQWLIMGIAYLTMIVNAPLWITLVIVAIFLLYTIIQMYYINKFNKEM